MFKIVTVKNHINKAERKHNAFARLYTNINTYPIKNNKFKCILILSKKQFGKKSENLKWQRLHIINTKFSFNRYI